MHSEPEIREDMEKLRNHIKALADKYGDEFSCILSAGVDMGKAWAGSSLVCGESYLVYQACRGLLEMPKVIDEFFDAVKDVLSSKELPDFLKEMTRESVESMKRMLIVETKAYKKFTAEKEINEAVQDLLKKSGFSN